MLTNPLTRLRSCAIAKHTATVAGVADVCAVRIVPSMIPARFTAHAAL